MDSGFGLLMLVSQPTYMNNLAVSIKPIQQKLQNIDVMMPKETFFLIRKLGCARKSLISIYVHLLIVPNWGEKEKLNQVSNKHTRCKKGDLRMIGVRSHIDWRGK